MTARTPRPALLLAVLLLLGASHAALRFAEPPESLPLPPASAAESISPVAPVAVGVPVAAAAPIVSAGTASPTTGGSATFADGSSRPSLNGAHGRLTMPWPGGGPFSPIETLVQHEGTWWWRHADGSMSTTIVRRDQVSGREVELPLCCRPAAMLADPKPQLRRP